jgi:hypothetical protein
MNNSIYIIYPERKKGVWMFTDTKVGLIDEPFVSGIPEIIDDYVGNENNFTLFFSASNFPLTTTTLTKTKDEFDGAWYTDNNTKKQGWLCPALLKYFKEPPEKLYLKIGN